jgi:hypothetical protein
MAMGATAQDQQTPPDVRSHTTTETKPEGSTTTTTQSAPTTTPAQTPPYTGSGGDVSVTTTTTTHHVGPRVVGLNVSLLGGALGYPNTLQGGQNAGPSYGAAIGYRVGIFGAEASYQGATYTPQGAVAFTAGASRITENGGQLIAKVGPVVGPVDLYVLGGGGVSHFQVSNDNSFPVAGGSVMRDGTIWKIPAGLGVDFHIPTQGFDVLIGARGQYNFLFNQNEVFSGTSNTSRDADQIQGQLNVGLQF